MGLGTGALGIPISLGLCIGSTAGLAATGVVRVSTERAVDVIGDWLALAPVASGRMVVSISLPATVTSASVVLVSVQRSVRDIVHTTDDPNPSAVCTWLTH